MTATLPEKRKCSEKLLLQRRKSEVLQAWVEGTKAVSDQRWTVDALKKTLKRLESGKGFRSHLTRNQNQAVPSIPTIPLIRNVA